MYTHNNTFKLINVLPPFLFANRYKNTGRTIIADNFFTTLNAVKRLANISLAFVGTVRHNKRFLPEEMKKNAARPVMSSQFGFHDNLISLCSYVPKKNKAVNLLSTVHYSKLCVGEAQKPEAIHFYNENKAGVDCMDQMVTHFSTKRPTKRWTLAFFYNMLDVMALAAFCICKDIHNLNNKGGARRKFIMDLAHTLALPNVENRMNNPNILKIFASRLAFESFFGRPVNIPEHMINNQRSGPDVLTGKRDCRLCIQSEKLRRKTRYFCTVCSNPVCQQHSKVSYICFYCATNNQ